MITELAVESLPADVPAYFKQTARMIADGSNDSDLFKNKSTAELAAAEDLEHYFAFERLPVSNLPQDRYEFLALLPSFKVARPVEIGMLPYAIMEWAGRLTICFAEYRQSPGDEGVRARCDTYAAILAHYTADACQPLHATIHGQGRNQLKASGGSSGIHGKSDALIQNTALDRRDIMRQVQIADIDSIPRAILVELKTSNGLVDTVYRLENKLQPGPNSQTEDAEAAQLARERLIASVRFTASILNTCWKRSASVTVPKF